MSPFPAQQDAQTGVCPHCQTPVEGVNQTFCCNGCEVAFHFIQGLGLDAYYRYRDDKQSTPVDALEQTEIFGFFESEDYFAQHVQTTQGRFETTWYLSGLHCAACTWLVEKICLAYKGIASVESRLVDGRLLLRFAHGTDLKGLAEQLAHVGYTAGLQPDANFEAAGPALLRLGISGAIAANIMLMSVPFYTGLSDGNYGLWFGWIAGLLSIPLITYGASSFFKRAWLAARAGTLDLDQPIAIGLLSAFLLSWWNLLQGEMHGLYFDSMGMLVFFLLAGRYIRNAGVRKALEAGRGLLSRVPKMVTVERNNLRERLPARRVLPGDRLYLRAGDVLPVDAVLDTEQASLNLHVVSGESKPVPLRQGESALAGAVNLGIDATFIAKTNYQDAAFARLAALSKDLYEGRNRQGNDRFAGWFLAGVTLSACAGWLLWWQTSLFQAAVVSMTIFIVACPCALALAAPTARAFALKYAAGEGIWIKNEIVFDRLHSIEEAVFDKTGILTGGCPKISEAKFFVENQRWLTAAIAAIQSRTNHPIAEAFQQVQGPTPLIKHIGRVETLPGLGLRGSIDGHQLVLLSPAAVEQGSISHQDIGSIARERMLCESKSLRSGQTIVCVFVDGNPAAVFGLTDGVRPEAAKVAKKLKHRKLTLTLLSGDGREPVELTGKALGFDRWLAEKRPADKLAEILRDNPHKKLLVGDGLNDMGALAAAGVSVTHAFATDAAIQFADVLLRERDLTRIPVLFEITETARLAMRRGLWLSLTYNAIAVSLTLAGLIGPLIAAVLMPLSSLSMIGSIGMTFRQRRNRWASSHF